ncbi:SDR family NAD(P)-dependent oxidoreductase [Glycomyces sp. NPDC047369]
MRVLVTGGAGFIGGAICRHLAARGDDVVVLDSLAAHEHAPEYLPDSAELIVGDLADEDAVRRAVEGADAVCHQAARVGLGVDFDDVTSYVADNDGGTAALLRALWRRSFTGRLVVASSMVVYGEGRYRCPAHGDVRAAPRTAADLDAGRFDPRCPACGATLAWAPVTEDAPFDPRNVYAATKVHTEHLSALYGRESGATVCALRYHNVYGPHMPRDTPYAGVASIFRSALESGRAPRVFEDGAQTRDFVHVDDVARANLAALDTDWTGACNIASGEPHTIADMAAALTAGFPGAPAPAITGDYRLGDVRHIVASPALAADRLNFRAETAFAAGMAAFAHAPLR